MKIIFVLLGLFFTSLAYSQEKKDSLPPCATKYVVPNSFIANADKIHEDFKPEITGFFDEYEFRIFDRWGKLVFETKDSKIGWNGKCENKNVEQGVYFYTISFACDGYSDRFTLSGYVNLIRH